MPKVAIFIVLEASSQSRRFTKLFQELFGLTGRVTSYLEKPLSIDPDMDFLVEPKKLFAWEDYQVEEELLEEIFKWLSISPREEDFKFGDHLASLEDYNKPSFYHQIKDFFALSGPERMEIIDYKPITLPINFKEYLRKNGKRPLLARCFTLDQSVLSGRMDFSTHLDFFSSKKLIQELVKENYENMVEARETIYNVFKILNTVVCRLTTSGKYIAKITCNSDPILHSISDDLGKKKNLDSLLPYAEWTENILVSNLKSINIYQYIGPKWSEFKKEWERQKESQEEIHFVPQGRKGTQSKRRRISTMFTEPVVPLEEEKAKELYSKLTSYPIDHADYVSRTNSIWKKKVWTRFPIEQEFPKDVYSYDDIKFLVESPYEDKDTYYDDERILSSFNGFRWDHQTLEEEYLKDLERKEEPREDGTVPWKAHLMIEEWLREHFCCGNQENYDFLKKWITFVNCYPNRKVSVAVALRGGNGLTKSFFSHLMSLNFGSHAFSAVDANLLFGNFTTSRLATSCFVTLEEAKLTGIHYSKFKDSVTGSSATTSNEKYGRIAEIIVMAAYLICTNNHHYYQCDMDDRRIFGLDFDNKFFKDLSRDILGDEGRWKEAVDIFTKQIMEKNYRMWRLYLGYLYSTVRPEIQDCRTLVSVRPNTSSLDKQKLLSLGEVEHWWISCLKDKQYIDKEFLDSDGVSKEGQMMKPKLVNYRPQYDEEYWDNERWLKVVHYKDLYLAFVKSIEKRGGKKSKVLSESAFFASFARNLPQELQENFSKLSSESPFIVFGPWRDHYRALTLMGWPISTSL